MVDEDVPAARIRAAVMEGGGELLRSAHVFDLYRGAHEGLRETLRPNRLKIHWARARLIADDPRKAFDDLFKF